VNRRGARGSKCLDPIALFYSGIYPIEVFAPTLKAQVEYKGGAGLGTDVHRASEKRKNGTR